MIRKVHITNWLLCAYCSVCFLFPFFTAAGDWLVVLLFSLSAVAAVLIKNKAVCFGSVLLCAVLLCVLNSNSLVCYVPCICSVVLYRAAVFDNTDTSAKNDLFFCFAAFAAGCSGLISAAVCLHQMQKMSLLSAFRMIDPFFIVLAAVVIWRFFRSLHKEKSEGSNKKKVSLYVEKKRRAALILCLLCLIGPAFYSALSLWTLNLICFPAVILCFVILLFPEPVRVGNESKRIPA